MSGSLPSSLPTSNKSSRTGIRSGYEGFSTDSVIKEEVFSDSDSVSNDLEDSSASLRISREISLGKCTAMSKKLPFVKTKPERKGSYDYGKEPTIEIDPAFDTRKTTGVAGAIYDLQNPKMSLRKKASEDFKLKQKRKNQID